MELVDVEAGHHRRVAGEQRRASKPDRGAGVDEAIEDVQEYRTRQVRPVCVELEKLFRIQSHPSILALSRKRLSPSGRTGRVRFSVNVPNFGDFADARTVAQVAAAAEAAGWDALFVWDHVVHDKQLRAGLPFGDPWMLLTAAALATSRLRLGPW